MSENKHINKCWIFVFIWKEPSCVIGAAAAKSLQSCPTLRNPVDCSLSGSSIPGIFRQEHWSGFPFLLQCMKGKSVSEVAQSCPTLRDPMDGSLPGSSFPGILQARALEWIAISFSNACMHVKQLQSCPTLCDPRDSSPPGSPVPGTLQARTLEWVSVSFSTCIIRSINFPSR